MSTGNTKVGGLLLTGLFFIVTVSCQPSLFGRITSNDHIITSSLSAADALAKNRIAPAVGLPSGRALTLEECRRMALARNLDLQTARIEEYAKRMITAGNSKKILPHLVATGELSERDNYGYSFSDVLGREGGNPNPASPGAGSGVTNYSVGRERATWKYGVELNWSPTDAALAYYLTKSSRNDRLRAHYQRVRVAQKLLGTVDASFHKLLSLQRLLPLSNRLVDLRSRGLDERQRLYEKKLVPIEECHRARQKYLKAARTRLAIEDDLERESNTLFSALSVSPDRPGGVGPRVMGSLGRPVYRNTIPTMEMTAVQSRPEAREAGLSVLNSTNDLTRAVVKCFPRVTGFWRYTRDKDRYLLHKDWKETGIRVYFDLAEWLSNWDESKAARHNLSKMQVGGGAVVLGIAVQVRMAALSYFRSLKELEYTEKALKSSELVLKTARVKASSNDLTKLALMEAEADKLEAEVDRTRALGESNAALAALHAAMGTNYNEPVPSN